MAREAGDPVHHEALVGEDLHLFVEDTDDGVNITMSWTPQEQGADTSPHSAAGQSFDPTGGSTAGLGQ